MVPSVTITARARMNGHLPLAAAAVAAPKRARSRVELVPAFAKFACWEVQGRS